jgi:hypothetical protein
MPIILKNPATKLAPQTIQGTFTLMVIAVQNINPIPAIKNICRLYNANFSLYITGKQTVMPAIMQYPAI